MVHLLTGITVSLALGAALMAWLTNVRGGVDTYTIFPLLGMAAWILMWSHYVSGSVKRYLGRAGDTSLLKTYSAVTGVIVLCLLLLHPGLLYIGLFKDGFGLPPGSAFAVYSTVTVRVALVLGITSLLAFLLYELHRWYRQAPWWRYIEYASIGAMGLVFVHALLIGGGALQGWFRVVWVLLGIILIAAIAYNWYYDKQDNQRGLTDGRN